MTARQPDMFGKERAQPRVLMHIVDADEVSCGPVDVGRGRGIFECARCGHRTDWIEFRTATEARRGLACPKCNEARLVDQHTCHWPGCLVVVPPKRWGCKRHWYRLPATLRAHIWKTYRPGQEITKDPSSDYLKAARAVQDWIAEQEKGR